jgi:excinuclease UvrABC ATPase subunit
MLKTSLLTRDNSLVVLERPDVDKIDGLSPVIAIEQKTTSKSPRSTVGTITEIYDSLCLLYAQKLMLIAIIQASRFV